MQGSFCRANSLHVQWMCFIPVLWLPEKFAKLFNVDLPISILIKPRELFPIGQKCNICKIANPNFFPLRCYSHLLHLKENILKSSFEEIFLQFLIFPPCLQSYQVMNGFLANDRTLRCTSHKRSLPKTGDLSWIGSVPSNEITRPNLHKFSRKKKKCRQRIFSRIFLPRLGT